MSERKEFKWLPDDNDYEKLANRSANKFVHFVGREAAGMYARVRYGAPDVFATQDYLETDLADKSTAKMVITPHRSDIETVLFPKWIHDGGLKYARPIGKVDLFQNYLMRKAIISLGSVPVARESEDQEPYFEALKIMHDKDVTWLYPEGKRKYTETHLIGSIKRGVVRAALEAENDGVRALLFPFASTGFNIEKDGKDVVSRDKRSWFGIGVRQVCVFGDPISLEQMSTPLHIPDSELSEAELGLRSYEYSTRQEEIKNALQGTFNLAFEARDGDSIPRELIRIK